MPSLQTFKGQEQLDPIHVGGKAASLIRLAQAGLPVPDGAVLTTDFFAPWFAAVQSTPGWAKLVGSPVDDWSSFCAALKSEAADLPLDSAQNEALAALRRALVGRFFAVRSSSPEEDLGSASFAGGYETVLGVTLEKLEGAIRHCFVSSLDARLLRYKRERGFDPFSPRLAVIVQTQIDSDVAGVGFSLNPLTNDYDEAVINASWGLGESVVSGAVTPDHFVVNRVNGEMLGRELGSKKTSLHVGQDGGLRSNELYRSAEYCLSDEQLGELVAAMAATEALFGQPIDIEFCFSGGVLYLLQARPITTFVPLPAAMLTPPGARRRVYMDIALSGGLTINAPISPIGQSWMARFARELVKTYLGELPVKLGPDDQMWFLDGGRMYQDLSNLLWLLSPARLAKGMRSKDALMADTIANVSSAEYRAAKRPSWVSLRMALVYPGTVWRLRRVLFRVARAALAPAQARQLYDREVAAFEAEFASLPDLPIPELIDQYSQRVIRHVLEVAMPGMVLALSGLSLVEWLVPARHKKFSDLLQRGFEGNVVVDMGAALYRMSRLLEPGDMADPELLARRLEARDLPAPFLAAWQDFLQRYGWRGPHEVDLGSARYADAPVLALRQMCMMAGSDFDPETVCKRHTEERQEAYTELMGRLGFGRRSLFRRAYRWIDLFGGARDTPKHDYLLFFAAVRRRAMQEGQNFVAAGRLDKADQVLDLTLEQIEAAKNDAGLDLRQCASSNTAFLDQLRVLVRSFPAVIDSRGRILRPAPRQEEPGQLRGQAISPGVVRGRVNVLHHPNEKPVLPGDVLVAHTTDPGWTPLFINAAAVVLEVGGMLQHGAVVAREYGKPCVGGISRLLERLHDGQMVEVDGNAGVVQILESSDLGQDSRTASR